MTSREKLIDYVKNGGKEFLCSPQIGAGAGFDTKLAGKTWIGETTLEDTRRAWEMFDVVPLYNFGLPDISRYAKEVHYEGESSFDPAKNRKIHNSVFCTPKGNLTSTSFEDELKGGCCTKYWVTDEEELSILEYYLDSLLENDDFSAVSEEIRKMRAVIGEENAMDIQWAMQPYELLCFPNTMDTAIFALTCPETFRRLMDKILRLDEKLLPAVAAGGSDFVFLGGPGSEMISPKYYEDFLVPYSKIVTQMAHQNGLLVYTHICSPVEPMLSNGYYNQMGIDLFETLSEAPVGNVKSIEDAFSKLDPAICTRGNIGLDRLLQCSPEEIYDQSMHILTKAHEMGRKHILGASDYMFYTTPEENVRAMAKAVRDFNASL